MLAAVYSPSITPGDPGRNAEVIQKAMERARAAGASLLVLPELCLTGCSCGDLFAQRLVQQRAEQALLALSELSGRFPGLTTVLGVPLRKKGQLYSCAAVLREGQLLSAAPLSTASLAPARGEGGVALSESLPTFSCGDLQVGAEGDVALLWGVWNAEVESNERLQRLALEESARGVNALLCAPGEGESVTDYVYTGLAVAAAKGKLLGSAEGELLLAELHPADRRAVALSPEREVLHPESPYFPYDEEDSAARCARILELQSRALAARLERSGCERLIVGLSGGSDSTLVMLACSLALRRLGRSADKLLAISMPGFGTTGRTRGNAERIAQALGAEFREIPIGESVALHLRDIGHDGVSRDVTYENAQARERTQILMDIGNMENGLDIGTGDLSEEMLGWCTYCGDQMSMFAINDGIPKSAVRRVLRYYAEHCAAEPFASVLRDVAATPPSPELLPGTDGAAGHISEEVMGPYELHEYFFWHWQRWGEGPREILEHACADFGGKYAPEVVKKWLRHFYTRFFTQQFKRSCAADSPQIFAVSLSPRGGLRLGSDLSARPYLAELD